MAHFFRKVWVWIAGFIILGALAVFLWPTRQGDTILYLIYDPSRVGEKNQVLGVADSLKEQLPTNLIQIDFELKNKDAFLTDIRSNIKPESKNKGIVLAAEVDSIRVLKELPPQDNVVIAHSSHQYTKDHADLKNIADVVTLPRYVVTPEIRESIESPSTQLLQTPGVPHNLTPKIIEEAYKNNKDSLPEAEKYIGVVLGGDAETPDKKVLYYTARESMQLAEFLAPLAKEKKAHLLILNGPRTGKHDQKTGKVIDTSHRDGTVDAITTAFIEALKKHGLKEGQDFTLLDFQFGKPSAYPLVLGALSATQSPIFVAGDSTSMVSETADCLPGLVTAYTDGAMNENHTKQCNSELSAGRIALLENHYGQWKLIKVGSSNSKDTKPAAQTIAETIKKRLGEKAAL